MWNYFEPRDGCWYHWDLNGAACGFSRNGDEWRAAVTPCMLRDLRPGIRGPEPAPPPPASYFIVAAGREVILRPYFYEKPYYIQFLPKIRLLPEAETRLDLALPPVLRLELAGELELLQFAPFLLSETWAGDDTMSGSLCISLPVPSPVSSFKGVSSFIYGELIFRNHTKATLDIDHLVLSANSLNIYEKEGRLLCESIIVDTNGGGELKVNPRPGIPEGYRTLTTAKKTGWGRSLPAGVRI